MEQELTYLKETTNFLLQFLITYSFQIIGAVIIFIVGLLVARWLGKLVFNLCQTYEVDVTLARFFSGLTKWLVLILTLVLALGKFGVQVTPFIAGIGAAALGAGLALQGLLSNYAAGLSLILTRPFKEGDTLSVNGYSGVVERINLDATLLVTEDDERISIPNRHLVGEVLTNSFDYRVVETTVGISYQDDPAVAIRALETALERFPEIAAEPKPQTGIENFGNSAIEIGVRYWAPTTTWFQTRYRVNMAFYLALKEAEITIPYPQLDVTLKNREN